MDDPVAMAVVGTDVLDDLPHLLSQLRAEVAQLRHEVGGLKQQNRDLRQHAHFWKDQHARAKKRIEQLQQQILDLQAENRKLRQQAFGRGAEALTRSEGDEKWLRELSDGRSGTRRRGQHAGRPGPTRRNYQHLPARVEMIELPPEKRCCPHCGQAYAERADTEDAELIEIEVRAYRRVLRRRRYQPQCRCTGPWRIVTAPAPAKLLPKAAMGYRCG